MTSVNPYIVDIADASKTEEHQIAAVAGLVASHDDIPHVFDRFQRQDVVFITALPTEKFEVKLLWRKHRLNVEDGPIVESTKWQSTHIPIGKLCAKIFYVGMRYTDAYDLWRTFKKNAGSLEIIEQQLKGVPHRFLHQTNEEIYNRRNGWSTSMLQ